MLIAEYYIKALQNGLYKRKDWVIDMFSYCEHISYDATENHKLYEYQLVTKRSEPNRLFFIESLTPEVRLLSLEDYQSGEPVARLRQALTLPKAALLNVKAETHTTFGNAFINCYILIYPFGDKFDFMTGEIDTGVIEKRIAVTLTDTPPPETPRDPAKIYVDEYLRYGEAMSSLEGFTMLCVQAASESTMVPNPLVVKRRNELYAQYKDQLDDPVIIAQIQMELAKLDRASLKEDVSKDYYIKGKSFDVIRMKRFAMYGREGGFGDETQATLIKSSLDEGWEVEAMPAMVDSFRSGSYSRGNSTALGGESVKTFYRIFQNVKISEEDCGSKRGMHYLLTEDNHARFVGLYQITPQGLVLLKESDTKAAIGQTLEIRSPMICQTRAPNFCKKCVGVVMGERPDAVHIVTSDVGSAFMGAAMGRMHGKAMRTNAYNPLTAIS